MKKIICISGIVLALTAAGCSFSKQDAQVTETPAPTIPAKIAEQAAGEAQTVETAELEDNELSEKIKNVNKNAGISTSVNPGMKMLSIDLPIEAEDEKLPAEFIGQVERIVESAGLRENKDFDYFYFCTGADNKVYISASFNRTDNGLVLDKLNAVEDTYSAGTSAAAAKSKLFKAAQ
ncbi:MAG: hypothetical protein J6N52_02595 [Clostridia bacterium]|nr:hypothetical protein [Clostridia bacterium]